MTEKQGASKQNQPEARQTSDKNKTPPESVFDKEQGLTSTAKQVQSGHRSISPSQVLQLQSSIGNKDTNRLLAGLMPGVDPEDDNQIVGGIQSHTALTSNNIMRQGDGPASPATVNISTSTNTGPTWTDHGHFDWRVGFVTNATSGWIIQELFNSYSIQDASGNDVVPRFTPHYWEAWAVSENSAVTPNIGPDNDYWIRPSRGNNTKGTWSMDGAVTYTTTDPATQGFTPRGVREAGILLSTTTAPRDPGMLLMNRAANGTWDSTTGTPTHAGAAGP
jgi:hypothetical protein